VTRSWRRGGVRASRLGVGTWFIAWVHVGCPSGLVRHTTPTCAAVRSASSSLLSLGPAGGTAGNQANRARSACCSKGGDPLVGGPTRVGLVSWRGLRPDVDPAVHAQVQRAGVAVAAGRGKGVLEGPRRLVAGAPARALDVVGGAAVVERPGDGLALGDLDDRRVKRLSRSVTWVAPTTAGPSPGLGSSWITTTVATATAARAASRTSHQVWSPGS
jgi:hypothetical protein